MNGMRTCPICNGQYRGRGEACTMCMPEKRKQKVLEILKDKYCKHCNKPLIEEFGKYLFDYTKARSVVFCSRKCTTAYYHTQGTYNHSRKQKRTCFMCGNVIKNSRFGDRFCTDDCQKMYLDNKKKQRFIFECKNCHRETEGTTFCDDICKAEYETGSPVYTKLNKFHKLQLDKKVIEDYIKRGISTDSDALKLYKIERELKKLNIHRRFYV